MCSQGANSRDSAFANYPDFLEWVSILFCWHVAANFVLFIIALLVARHFRYTVSRVSAMAWCDIQE